MYYERGGSDGSDRSHKYLNCMLPIFWGYSFVGLQFCRATVLWGYSLVGYSAVYVRKVETISRPVILKSIAQTRVVNLCLGDQ